MQVKKLLSTGMQSYTVEPINDPDFLTYPPPPPVHPMAYQFTIAHSPHDEMIAVSSPRLRNISVTLENTGSTLIKSPYLYGPQGYDFRNLSKLASTITAGAVTNEEKFFRVHEWMDDHFVRTEVAADDPLVGMDGTLRRLNQYGGSECGENVQIVGNLLRYVPPLGSMYARMMDLGGLHQTGEAFWDGRWHNFDATPEARFVYYDWDNTTISPGWNDLKNDINLVRRVEPWTGWDMSSYVQDASTVSDYGVIGDVGAPFDFNYDLRPNESVAMYFDMRGRVDMISITFDTRPWSYRTYADYGSAVFKYKPDLTTPVFQNYLTEQTNVTMTANGLVPTDPSKPASIVIPVRSTWGIAGADIKASFKTGGNVYIARNSDYLNTAYSSNIAWTLLSQQQTSGYFQPSTIQGAMAYWLKFEWQGSGSGLDSVEIATEVTMSPWSMPGLEYGMNNIHFDAAAIEGGSLKVTYTYDDQSDQYFYQPAANYGRHIGFRLGGVFTDSARKQEYFKNLKETPSATEQVILEITKVSGISTPTKVRTLINNATMSLGYYKVYWDGKDNSGNVLAPGMYAYKLTENEVPTQGARLYLFGNIWPQPNEIRYPLPNQAPVVNAGPNQTITLPASASLNARATDDGLPAGSTLTVSWSQFSGPGLVTFGNVKAPSTTASFSSAGTYVLRLTASDSELFSSADVVITVMPPAPPLVDAGPRKVIAFPAKDLTLFGHATTLNNGPLTVQWTLTNGPAPVRFSARWGLATTVTFTIPGTYTFQLAVSDGTYNVTSSTTVTVNPASSQTEFYVDPTYAGSMETGAAATPWKTLIETDPSSNDRWGKINAALAAGPVIVYFSARNAATDSAEEIVGSVRVRRTDKSTNRLTLDGMSRYNTNDTSPSWVDYAGGSRMRIRVTSGCCLSIGWYSLLSGDGKLDYVTLRGFEVTGSGARITWGGSYSVLEYIWSHDVTTLGGTVQFDPAVTAYPDCADLGKSHDITIRNVLVERGIGEGIYIGGTSLYISDGGCPATGNNHNDILIEGNTVREPGVNGGWGTGLDLNAGLFNVTVRNNTFVNPHAGNGITLLGTFGPAKSNYFIEANIIVNTPVSAALVLQSTHGVIIRNNLIYNSAGEAIALSGDSSYSNSDVEMYNNTLYRNGATIWLDHVDRITIKDNLIFGNSSPGYDTSSSNITSDYNLWAPANATWSEGPHSPIQASTSGIVEDPASGDFRLALGSPAIGNGLNLSATGFATDINGNPRPQVAAWSIGAYDVPPISDTNRPLSSSATFAIPDGGGQSWVMTGASESLHIGYARMQQDTGSSALSGLAILEYRSRGVLVTEASVPASPPIYSGCIYVDVNGPVNTGIAFANANGQAAAISFYFTDTAGNEFGRGSFIVNAGSQLEAFLNQAPFRGRSSMQGTFSFSSSVPVGVIAFRGFINERSEFLTTTLPVTAVGETTLNSVVLPVFTDGGGWMTQIILTNPSNSAVAGYVQFFGPGSSGEDAQPLSVSVNGASNTTFSYMLAPGATTRLVTDNSGGTMQAGSVRITPTSGTAPTAMAIFSFRNNGITVSEAVISAGPPGLAFRMYTETSGSLGQIGSVESGLALTNPLPAPVTVNLDLYNMDGSSPVLPITLTVAGNGQVSRFVRELFPGLSAPFQGFLSVTATAPIAVTGVRGRYNERRDFLITTTPPRNEDVILPSNEFLFPHVVSGAGYSTQLVIFGESSSSRLWFNSQDATILSTDTLQPDH